MHGFYAAQGDSILCAPFGFKCVQLLSVESDVLLARGTPFSLSANALTFLFKARYVYTKLPHLEGRLIACTTLPREFIVLYHRLTAPDRDIIPRLDQFFADQRTYGDFLSQCAHISTQRVLCVDGTKTNPFSYSGGIANRFCYSI